MKKILLGVFLLIFIHNAQAQLVNIENVRIQNDSINF